MKLIIIALVVVILLSQLWRGVLWINQTQTNGVTGGFEELEWQYHEQINLFINPDWIVGYDSVDNSLHYFRLESPITIDELRVTSRQEKVLLDGYLILSDGLAEITTLSDLISESLLEGRVESNLNRWQTINLWWRLREGPQLVEEKKRRLPENTVIEEALKISLMNGTDVPGLAGQTVGWLRNIGAEVIEVGNAEEKTTQTRIDIFWEDGDWRTIDRLEEIFGVEATFVPTDQPMRHDIGIIIGDDFLR